MSSSEIQDIDCVFQGFLGKGAIFVSNIEAARSPKLIQEFSITAIISIARSGYVPNNSSLQGYLYIPAEDVATYPLKDHFEQTYDFLQKHRKDGNVLVHCMSGISRSATVVAAYLLQKYRYSLSEVLSLLQRKRQKVNPNKGFMKQLEEHSLKLGLNMGRKKSMKWSYSSTTKNSTSKNSTFHSFCKKQKEVSGQNEEKGTQKTMVSSRSLQKSKEEQKEISDKIERLRERVMMVGKYKSRAKNEKMKMVLESIESAGSATLPQNQKIVQLKENKSLQLQ